MDEERFSKEAPIDEYTHQLFKLSHEIGKYSAENKLRYFIGGGIAIDLLLGKITRNHHDIDFYPELKDTQIWIEWFEGKGYKVIPRAHEDFPETYKVENQDGEDVVDLWPLRLEGEILLINHNGEYVDSGRKWNETRTAIFEGQEIRVENPERVLEQKLRHAKRGEKFRLQDAHDFRLLGKTPVFE